MRTSNNFIIVRYYSRFLRLCYPIFWRNVFIVCLYLDGRGILVGPLFSSKYSCDVFITNDNSYIIGSRVNRHDGRNVLFKNQADGNFRDVAAEGMMGPVHWCYFFQRNVDKIEMNKWLIILNHLQICIWYLRPYLVFKVRFKWITDGSRIGAVDGNLPLPLQHFLFVVLGFSWDFLFYILIFLYISFIYPFIRLVLSGLDIYTTWYHMTENFTGIFLYWRCCRHG